MKTKILISIILSISIYTTSNAAKGISIQDRLLILEKQMKKPQDNRSNMADVVSQVQTLQQQIAELKGVIEEQIHQINSLKEKQKLLYIDIDSRLTEIESNRNTSVAGSTLENPTSQTGTNNNNSPKLTVEVDEGYNSGITTQAINEPALSSDQDDYDIAFAHLRAGRFLESARAFEDFIQKYPNNDLTDNAYYWLGESYYVKRQYPQALAAFQSLTKKFPASNKAADSWLKIGYSYYEMDDTIKAEENLQKVIDNYPTSSLARLAKNRLRQLQRDH
jgi:tol-pal system protein YbgF